MTGSFRIIHASPDSLILKAGPHGLDDRSGELFAFVASVLESGRVSLVTLDASETTVTLEGIGALIRLHQRAAEAHADLRIDPSNPRLDRKLAETGTLGMFVAV
jgi:hypothetical protein